MPIYTVAKKNNYVTISNYHLFDTNLSLDAKGLLTEMLAFAESWNYKMDDLIEVNQEDMDTIQTFITELEDNGYLTKETVYIEKDLPVTCYTIYEKPKRVKH